MLIVFTDLDGTLLDKNYSFDKAKKALASLKKQKIPLVFCTSKTRAETELYQKKLSVNDPFIVENGGAVYIPKDYFDFDFRYDKKVDDYLVIEFGTEHKALLASLRKIAENTSSEIIPFSDMTAKQVAKECNLPLKEARLAKNRDYVEPFKLRRGNLKKLISEIKKQGLNYTSSIRFNYIMGKNDKGKAVKNLAGLFRRKYSRISTVAIGDSLNDLPMLKAADRAFLVKNYDGEYNEHIRKIDTIKKAGGKGPEGWSRAVSSLISD